MGRARIRNARAKSPERSRWADSESNKSTLLGQPTVMTNVRIPAAALVLIADGTKARLLRNKGNTLHVDFVIEWELEQENPPTREQGTDKPGRYLAADRISRSAVEQTDWHRQAEERFAVQIAELLYGMAHAHTFDQLVVIAAPKVL